MRMRVMAGLLLGAGSAFAQPVPPPDLPPLGLNAPPKNAPGAMPGVMVSQALQAPVDVPPLPSIPRIMEEREGFRLQGTGFKAREDEPSAKAPRFWASGEYLLWWPKQQPLLPLLNGNNSAFSPLTGNPGTVSLLGSQSVVEAVMPGGRITLGGAFGQSGWGAEAGYFFLGTQNRFYTSAGFTPDSYRALGVPYTDANTGEEAFYDLRSTGFPERTGELQAFTSTRVTGWEGLISLDLYDAPSFRFIGLAGYRYFRANEGLLIATRSDTMTFDPNFNFVPQRTATVDEVSATNVFQGGALGTRTSVNLGGFFFDWDSKVSFGNVRQTVSRFGRTQTTTDNVGGAETTTSESGIFVNPTNAGRFVRTTFAVLPETGMKVGYTFGAARLFFGYNVIYLSDAVRPADQLDRTVDATATLASSPLGRPSPAIVKSDFWVQGLSFGLELRY